MRLTARQLKQYCDSSHSDWPVRNMRFKTKLATGNVIIWDGNLRAPRMADQVIEKLTQLRLQASK